VDVIARTFVVSNVQGSFDDDRLGGVIPPKLNVAADVGQAVRGSAPGYGQRVEVLGEAVRIAEAVGGRGIRRGADQQRAGHEPSAPARAPAPLPAPASASPPTCAKARSPANGRALDAIASTPAGIATVRGSRAHLVHKALERNIAARNGDALPGAITGADAYGCNSRWCRTRHLAGTSLQPHESAPRPQ